MRLIAILLAFLASPLHAHEFWIEPLAYQIPADGRLEGHIVNGQSFGGVKLAYIPQRFHHFYQQLDEVSVAIEGRVGDSPALQADPLGEGLAVVTYQSTLSTISYETWEKFERFAEHKDFVGIHARHMARSLPEDGFSEGYTRYCKTLIGVGNGAGADQRIGLESEFVALTNPYTDDLSDGFRVQLFYQYGVRADTQIELYEKDPEGNVEITVHRTDADGIATLPVKAGYTYMIDAVVLRAPSPALATETGAVWETLWASLTFAAPEE